MSTAKRHVLIVDDITDNCNLLLQVLERDYRVTVATNGQEAIEQIELERPDLLLLDLMMPVLDGFGVLDYVNAHPEPFLPIIVTTAATEQQERVRALEAGANEFLNKPIHRRELLARAATLMSLKVAREKIEQQAGLLRDFNARLRTDNTMIEHVVWQRTQALQEREILLQHVQAAVGFGIWQLSLDTHELDWSDELYRMYGLEPQSCPPSFDLIMGMTHPDDRNILVSTFETGGPSLPYDRRITLGNGAERVFRTWSRNVRDDDGVAVKLIGATQDVTDQVKSQAAVYASEAMLRAVVENATDMISIRDLEGRFVLINPQVERSLGSPNSKIVGKTLFDLVAPEAAARETLTDQVAINSPEPFIAEISVETPIGPRDHLVTKYRYAGQDGVVQGVVSIRRDVTQRNIEAEKARRLQSELEIAAVIQRGLLPSAVPNLPNLAIAGYCRQAGAIGGDGYDFVPNAAGLSLIIADVSGHGVAAALLLSNFLSQYRASSPALLSSGALAQRVNRHFCDSVGNSGQFVTGVIAHISAEADAITCASMGHYPPLLQRSGVITALDMVAGLPAGIFEECHYAETRVSLQPGDRLIFYTDGFIEARSPEGEFLGFDRLCRALEQAAPTSEPADIIQVLVEACKAFEAGSLPDDDQTAIVVCIR